MTREGMTPLTPLTTAQLEELADRLGPDNDGEISFEDIRSIQHAIAELIDMRAQLQRIAAACPDKDTANALIELVGVDA
jgi:hypothetical protein